MTFIIIILIILVVLFIDQLRRNNNERSISNYIEAKKLDESINDRKLKAREHFNKAIPFLRNDEYYKAIHILELAHKSDPENIDYKEAYDIASKELILIISMLENFKLRSRETAKLVIDAIHYYKNEEYGKASFLLKKVLLNEPNNKDVIELYEHCLVCLKLIS